MTRLSKFMPQVLVLLSVVLTVWGLLGLLEYFLPSVALGLQNRNFPAGLQFLHFFSILVTGAVFIGGYFTRWQHTPFATIIMYAVLATLCFVETVDFEAFGGGATRFIPMVTEYIAYVCIAAYLLRSTVMQEHFRLGSGKSGTRARKSGSGNEAYNRS